MRRRSAVLAVVLLLYAGCTSAPPPTTIASPTPTAEPSPTLPAGAVRFVITNEGSRAFVRITEQLAINPGPNEAVVEALHCLSGEIVLLPDGAFARDKKVVMEMWRLRSDQSLRDTWISLFGPQTNRFRTAEFTPERAEGLPAPLPVSGSWTFTMVGTMRMHGVDKITRWNAEVQRAGEKVTARARTTVTWSDFDMGKPAGIPQVASIEDEFRLEITFEASARP
jgi:hypothetical protein